MILSSVINVPNNRNSNNESTISSVHNKMGSEESFTLLGVLSSIKKDLPYKSYYQPVTLPKNDETVGARNKKNIAVWS